MVYSDGVHLIGDSVEELHSFARGMGLKKEWFQSCPRHPHYDLTTDLAFFRALSCGAKLVTKKHLVEILLRKRRLSHEQEGWKVKQKGERG